MPKATRWGIAYKPPRRKKRQVEEPRYVEWLHTQACICRGFGSPCKDGIQVDHGSGKGMGQRREDAKGVPMCAGHHEGQQWTITEPWLAMGKWGRAEWIDQQIIQLRLRWLIRLAEMAPGIPF